MGFFIQCGSEIWFHFLGPISLKTQTQNGSEFWSLGAVESGTRLPKKAKKAFGVVGSHLLTILHETHSGTLT
jgi:hypothetical protein